MRLFRVLKFAVLGVLGIVGVGLIAIAVRSAAVDRQLEKVIAELKTEKQPTTLSDLARKPVPPEQNAATFLRRAAEGQMAIESAVEAARDKLGHQDADVAWENYHAVESLQNVLHKAFDEHADTVKLLEQASHQTVYDPQLDFEQPPTKFLEGYLDTMQSMRQPIRVLNYRVVMLLTEGKREEALDTCLAMLRLCRLYDQQPLLVGCLVSLACRSVSIEAANHVLRSGELPEEAHDKLDAELAKHDLGQAYADTLRTERAYGIDCFKDFDTQIQFLMMPANEKDFHDYLGLLSGLISQADKPYEEVLAWLQGQNVAGLTKLIIPAAQAAFSAKTRTTAQLRAAQVLNALARRGLMDGDNTPPLDALGLPAAVIVDPYSGKSLLVTGEANEWIVYAVGENLKDDGGKIYEYANGRYEDVGLGPGKKH
jgi:hypothetical protein